MKLVPPAEPEAPRPVARVMQLVAALKAEQESAASSSPEDRVKLMSSLREILVERDHERGDWEERLTEMHSQLDAAQEGLRMAHIATEQAEAHHRRLVADLKLMHEHQRSIWTLERRRLEITVDALENARRKTLAARLARLARPAVAVALLLVAITGFVLASDSSATGGKPAGHLIIGGFQLD
ncbi:MAG TPA: hypothetical protein VLX85_16330 [Stellaceae bacterium]|nr:hypothetical protein [Stellaceae bacterium]